MKNNEKIINFADCVKKKDRNTKNKTIERYESIYDFDKNMKDIEIDLN